MLNGIAKDAGLSATEELHRAADEALGTIDHETIPAAEAAARAIVNQAIYEAAGVIADLANRLDGAELPVNITISGSVTITGKIGALKLSAPEMVADPQKVEVVG